jgi:polysaccharide transporter, PST family
VLWLLATVIAILKRAHAREKPKDASPPSGPDGHNAEPSLAMKDRWMKAHFDDHQLQEGLGRQSLRSGAIVVIGRAVNAMVQVGAILFLARLLTPEDYGLVAMVTALTGFAPLLVDLGTRDAVVQRVSITEGEVSALFWLTVGVGCAFALAISASGPLIAAFYREPRLTAIVRVASLTFVALALTAQHEALVRRAMLFRELAMIGIAAHVLSACGAIGMAYFGLGYWALVTRPIALYSLTAAGIWWYCRWLPCKPVVTSGVREMVKFGLNLCGFLLSDFVGRNSDRVMVGRGLGVRTLGYYQSTLLIYDNLLEALVLSLHQVAVSSLSKLQNDLEELRRSWGKALSTVAFYGMPAFGILAITSGDLIVLLLGQKWAPAGALLSVLALRGIAQSAELSLAWLHVAAGRTDRWLRWGVLATCVKLLALFCGLPFGPFGIVWAHVFSMYVLFVPGLAYAGRPLGIGARDVIVVIGAQFAGALATAGVGFALRASLLARLPEIERMAILVLLYLAMYLVVVVGLFRVTVPLKVGRSLVQDFLPGPFKSSGNSNLP